MPQAAPVALQIRGLHKRFGAVEAVDGLSFDLHAGEVLGLLGPNGAGKTTTVESIAGLVEPDAGTIILDGNALTRSRRGRIGLALQATSLQNKITPREALALFASLYGTNPDIPGLLQRVGLVSQADTCYGRLSGGQKQRVAFALALVNDPSVLLLDEATAGIDPVAKADLHRLIRELAERGCAILLTTHDMAEAERLCDRVLIVDHGKAVTTGSPADLVRTEGGSMVVEGRTASPVDPAAMPIPGLVISGCDFRCRTSAPGHAGAQILEALYKQGIEIVSLRIGPATLEDVILGLTAGRQEP